MKSCLTQQQKVTSLDREIQGGSYFSLGIFLWCLFLLNNRYYHFFWKFDTENFNLNLQKSEWFVHLFSNPSAANINTSAFSFHMRTQTRRHIHHTLANAAAAQSPTLQQVFYSSTQHHMSNSEGIKETPFSHQPNPTAAFLSSSEESNEHNPCSRALDILNLECQWWSEWKGPP